MAELCNIRKVYDHLDSGEYIYIGRKVKRGRYELEASPWGNPFKVGVDGDIFEVLEKYANYVLESDALLELLPSLEGKKLACWCYPQQCHGDVLISLLEMLREGKLTEVIGSQKSTSVA